MVERRKCSFCGSDIEPGTGKIYVKKDGTVFYFCKNKCQKNMLDLKRVPRNVHWSKLYSKKQ
jgi:large subunit ribosomal protein L24e